MGLGDKHYRRIWPDRFAQASRKLTQRQALLLAHLLIGRPSGHVGIVAVDPDYLALDCKATPDEVAADLEALDGHGFVAWDRANACAYMVGVCIDDPWTNPNHRKGMEAAARLFPEGVARLACLTEIGGEPYRKAFDTLAEAYRNPTPTPTPTPKPTSVAPAPDAPTGAAPAPQPRQEDLAQPVKRHRVKAHDPADPDALALLAAYRRLLPMLAQPLDPPADGTMRELRAALRRDDVPTWTARFERAASSPFLTGQKADWRATLPWLLGPKNAAKLDGGQYDNHKAPPASNYSPKTPWIQPLGPADPNPEDSRPLTPEEIAEIERQADEEFEAEQRERQKRKARYA